jgi:hypothetical protein
MKFPSITIVLLLCILLVSGLACSLGGGESETTDSIPSAPILSSPNNETVVHGTSVTFQWNASAGATQYGLRVSKNPNLAQATSFFNAIIGDFTVFILPGFPDDGTVYYWGVWAGNAAGWSTYDEAFANSRSFTNGDEPLGDASLAPRYNHPRFNHPSEKIIFLLTAWAREPSYLDIWNPNGSLLDQLYVPPMVEVNPFTENIDLPPAPSGGTYKFDMYSELSGELVWQGEQTFTGPKMEVVTFSLNPHWVQGVGWELQHLTMTLKNTGDMPIILNGLKLRLEKDGFSTEEITLARAGDAGAEYGWYRKEGFTMEYGVIWGLVPFNNTFNTLASIVPWVSEDQFLFGQYFDPGEYTLYLTLSDQLIVLPAPELAFESP